MRFRNNATLDASAVSDRRGMPGALPLTFGGGGLVGLIFLIVTLLSNGSGAAPTLGGASLDNSNLSAQCQTGADANQQEDCRIVGVINSVQKYWSTEVPNYQSSQTVFFTQATATACGTATSDVGPFYCPNDKHVYIDLSFYDELRSRFGANGGPFAEAYVIAHEYGHHIQDLRGSLQAAPTSGANGSSVHTELQADCYAGMWAQGATKTGYIQDLSQQDIADGLDAAAAVGDDRIQKSITGQVDPEKFTHGTSVQRQQAFNAGFYANGMSDCDI